MKVKRIILLYEKYGRPTIEKHTKETININCINKEFETQNGVFKFKSIKHVNGGLFRIISVFGTFDYCFRPKWYEFIEIGLYYILYGKIACIISLFKQIIVKKFV